jgi:hypothetical protein
MLDSGVKNGIKWRVAVRRTATQMYHAQVWVGENWTAISEDHLLPSSAIFDGYNMIEDRFVELETTNA